MDDTRKCWVAFARLVLLVRSRSPSGFGLSSFSVLAGSRLRKSCWSALRPPRREGAAKLGGRWLAARPPLRPGDYDVNVTGGKPVELPNALWATIAAQ